MKTRILSAALLVPALAILTACSDSSTPTETAKAETEKKAAEPEGPVTGLTAFWDMHKLAYEWAPDIAVLNLASQPAEGIPSVDGKAAVWQAVFASPSRSEIRAFTYNAVAQGSTRRGVSAGLPQAWGGPTTSAETFPASGLNTDTDKAYAAASAQAASWIRDNPGKSVSYILGKESRFPAPVWSVMWGDSRQGYAVLVDVSSGEINKR